MRSRLFTRTGSQFRNVHSQFRFSPDRRRYAIALTPGLIALIFTAFIDFAPLNPGAHAFLFWTPLEASIWVAALFGGIALANHREMRLIRRKLSEVSLAEENRRAIAAIGMAASWDLDLNRLYQRVSQDLRSILKFDRFTITGALPTGRMRIEFVSGAADAGYPAGAVLPEVPDQPDGLYEEFQSKYGSRLTAAMPACNGTLTIRSYGKGEYSAVHLDLLRQAVAQISPGIANAILFRSSERRLRERTALAGIGLAATSVSEPHRIFEAVDTSLKKLVNYDHLGVILLDERDDTGGTGFLTYWSNPGLSGLNAGDLFPFNSESAEQGVVVSAIGSEFTLNSDPVEPADGDLRAWLRAPLFVQEKLIGVMVVSSVEPGALGEEEAALMLNVSLQIAPAIQNANLTATLKRRADERRIVAAIGLAANSELNLEAIYSGLVEELAKVIDFDRITITYLRPDDGLQEIAYTSGIAIEGFAVGDTANLTSRKSTEKVSSDPTSQDWSSTYPQMTSFLAQSGLKSRVSAPLGTEPNILGQLHIASVHESRYADQDIDLIERIAIQIAPAIRNARMIAAERELRETLDRQNRELYEANNARKQFLSTVSHELKTPLTIIAGFIDLLAAPDESMSEEERRETFGIIRRNAESLDVLINDILDISRLDAGTFKITSAAFSANDLISDLEASFQSVLRTKTQTLAVDMGEDELWVKADRARISQVITNLLSNASKYSPDETEITLGCRVDGQRLKITVTDQGAGMSEEEQNGLFTAFFRADNEMTRTVPGTGLGLVIAKSITELHGGEIRLESRPGTGTTIEIWLPGLATREAAEAEMTEQQAIAGSRLWPEGLPDDIGLGAD